MYAAFQENPALFEQFRSALDVNRGNLAVATKSILEARYPQYKILSMIPAEKRTKEQKQELETMYSTAEATAREMMRKGQGASSGGSSGKGGVDTSNPLLKGT
jgi:hypothetical protein